MATSPGVSVVMPVFRPDPTFLRQAIESVLHQTLEDWELMLVEDPSDQPAGPVVASIADSRIRHVVNSQRTSLVEQLNQGLALAKSELVARFDADDICHPARLAEQAARLRESPELDVLGVQLRIINAQGEIIGKRHYPRTHEEILATLPRRNPLAHPGVMFRREVVVALGGYRATSSRWGALPWCQDYELWSRLARQGRRFANLEQYLLDYRAHGQQIKAQHLRECLRATLAIKRLYWSQSLGLRGRARLGAESLLACLPSSLVGRLFWLSHAAPGWLRKAP